MSAFGGKADIAAKLLTRDEARRIIAKLPESVRGFIFPLRCSLNINRGKGGSLWRKPLRK
jgi:hypothetical protein